MESIKASVKFIYQSVLDLWSDIVNEHLRQSVVCLDDEHSISLRSACNALEQLDIIRHWKKLKLVLLFDDTMYEQIWFQQRSFWQQLLNLLKQ